jgi:hypothetical protein
LYEQMSERGPQCGTHTWAWHEADVAMDARAWLSERLPSALREEQTILGRLYAPRGGDVFRGFPPPVDEHYVGTRLGGIVRDPAVLCGSGMCTYQTEHCQLPTWWLGRPL